MRYGTFAEIASYPHVWFIIARGSDIVTTLLALQHGGSEGNPWLHYLIQHAGVGGFVVVNVAVSVLVLYWWRENPTVLKLCAVVSFILAASNLIGSILGGV